MFSLSKASASVLMSGAEVSVYVRRDATAQPVVDPRDLRECPTLALQGFARKIGMGGNIEAAGRNAGLRDRRAAHRLGVERHALAV